MQNLGGNKVHYGLCENDEYFEGLVPFDWTCFCVVKWLKSTATRCKKKKNYGVPKVARAEKL